MVLDNTEHIPSTTQSGISIRSLWKVFGKNPDRLFKPSLQNMDKSTAQRELDLVIALKDVSFDVTPGETFVVMGLSGSGKSTLVRCLINLIEPTSGSIIVDGRDITKFDQKELREFRRSQIAMVFQNFGLLPHKNVLDNAAYGLEVKGIDKQQRHELAQKVLVKVGLEGWEQSDQRELSGGMQQRVGLARALAMDPSILLMDEPFSGLDPLIRRQMREELSILQEEIQKTIIFITHDLDEAITVGDRIAIMRDGEILQVGTPKEIILNPANSFVSEFTQGIPKSKVLRIQDVISDPLIIVSTSDCLTTLKTKMDNVNTSYAIMIENETKYLGMVTRDKLSDSLVNDASEILNPNVIAVRSDMTFESALTHVNDSTLPIPVIDGEDNFIGVATQLDLLKIITRN